MQSLISTQKDSFVSSLDIKSATQALIDLTKKLDGKIYLCGGGSETYLEEDKFKQQEIKLEFQNFTHPIYDQRFKRVYMQYQYWMHYSI